MYYFNARWYDPELGRFITEDPVKDGVNWFVYCSNNPLRYTDPTGLLIQEAKQAFAQAASSGQALSAQQQAGLIAFGAVVTFMVVDKVLFDDAMTEAIVEPATELLEAMSDIIEDALKVAGETIVDTAKDLISEAKEDGADPEAVPTENDAQNEQGISDEDKDKIANGHAGKKHKEELGADSAQDIIDEIDDVLDGEWTEAKQGARDRAAYHNPQSEITVIHDPKADDKGTIFRDPDGEYYHKEFK